ncbi:MAG TPA: hypothetical protein VLK82_13940 [Candidatus Tectomicrobia bacterium]|nr:hypothetical protein [Candidatus Tectomicrobia bacterium]
MAGAALKQVCTTPKVAQALFGILQIHPLVAGKAKATVMPSQSDVLAEPMVVRPP